MEQGNVKDVITAEEMGKVIKAVCRFKIDKRRGDRVIELPGGKFTLGDAVCGLLRAQMEALELTIGEDGNFHSVIERPKMFPDVPGIYEVMDNGPKFVEYFAEDEEKRANRFVSDLIGGRRGGFGFCAIIEPNVKKEEE